MTDVPRTAVRHPKSHGEAIMLSIIIPVYKSERYITECLDSIASQIINTCEVILVDDGSPDGSIELVKSRYKHFLEKNMLTIIHQENLGPGAARNRGVRAARGAYIGFLDSDDVLLPGYFEAIKYHLSCGDNDLVQFHCKRFSNPRNLARAPIIRIHRAVGRFSLDEVRNEIFGAGKWFPVVRVYRRELLMTHPFVESHFYEDPMSIPFIFLENHKITLLNECFYGYRLNPESTTSNHTLAHAQTLVNFFFKLSSLPESEPINILKVQVGRTLSYFAAELKIEGLPVGTIVESIKSLKFKNGIFPYLTIPDRLFLMAPGLYFRLDKWRIRRS
jgi:glycosyltransferase involved in cell wall biosynthesis